MLRGEGPCKNVKPLLLHLFSGSIDLVTGMKVKVIDIETFGNVEGLRYLDYKYLKTRTKREQTDEEVEEGLSLNPYFLNIISAAITHVEDGEITKASVYFLSDLAEEGMEKIGSVEVSYSPICCPSVYRDLFEGEGLLLENFWGEIEGAERIVTYNGRAFDIPVLRLRSMLHDLEIPQSIANFRPSRGDDFHLDLMDFLSLQNSEHRYTLEFVCRKFGIGPGKQGMDGSKVGSAFLEGQFFEIAEYNARDTIMTAELYLRLEKYIFPEGRTPELPATEKQLSYLADLLVQQNFLWDKNTVKGILSYLCEKGILTRSEATSLIGWLKEEEQ